MLPGSLRRKMVIGLCLSGGVLAALCIGALTGLASYRRLVRELSYSIDEAPRRADLSRAIGALFEPLLHAEDRERDRAATAGAGGAACDRLLRTSPAMLDRADATRRDFEKRLAATRTRLMDFHRRLDQLEPDGETADRKQRTEEILAGMERELADLQDDAYLLGDVERRGEALPAMLQQVARLESQAQQIPDFQRGLHASLDRARNVYRSRIRIVAWTTPAVALLFAGLGCWLWLGVLRPLARLHEGALRVAGGDFRYQLDLPGRGEIAELGDAFNRMTARFQEKQDELNRQVDDRCRQLVRSERLAGIGFLAAGVAHEINNPLSAISMAAESLSQQSPHAPDGAPDDETFRTYLAMIRREAERCREITRRLLDFARGNDGERRPTDLTQLVVEVLEMVRPMNRYRNCTIEFFRTESCFAEVNGPEIKQVILNVVSNALESLQDDGTLRIRILDRTDFVELLFQDDGCGMTDEVLAHLFEPFFTRRRDGRGTGLGMAISQRIVADHGGALHAESAGTGKGSTFRLQLPRRAASKSHAA